MAMLNGCIFDQVARINAADKIVAKLVCEEIDLFLLKASISNDKQLPMFTIAA